MESGGPPLYSCRNCLNPLALGDDLVSKTFKAKSGQAYMFLHAMNVVLGPKYAKHLLTGPYTIADIYCSKCRNQVGWKYVQAYDLKQRYKEGKFVLEKLKMIGQY